jgi:hypothetical protein
MSNPASPDLAPVFQPGGSGLDLIVERRSAHPPSDRGLAVAELPVQREIRVLQLLVRAAQQRRVAILS